MSTSHQVVFEANAGAKVLLHAIKYPHASVNGLLLGTVSREKPLGSPPVSPRGQSGDSAGPLKVTVTDAVPLMHTNLALTMPLDMALNQVDAYVAGKNVAVVGYYQANERLGDSELGPLPKQIGELIQQRYPGNCSVATMLNANKMDAFYALKDHAGVFEAYIKDGTKGWARAMPASSSGPSLSIPSVLPSVVVKMLQEGAASQLADFDDHLDDLSKDWLNQKLVKA